MMKDIRVMESIINKQFNNGGISCLNQDDVDDLVDAYQSYMKWLCKDVWDKICKGDCKSECHTLTWIDDIKKNCFIRGRSVPLNLTNAEEKIVDNAKILLIDIINACGKAVYDHITIDHNLFTENGILNYRYNFEELVKGSDVNLGEIHTILSTEDNSTRIYVMTIEENVDVFKRLNEEEIGWDDVNEFNLDEYDEECDYRGIIDFVYRNFGERSALSKMKTVKTLLKLETIVKGAEKDNEWSI